MGSVAHFQSASRERRASSVSQAVHHLRSWPALTLIPTAAGAVFTSGGHEIVRLSDHTAHLHLTTPVIERLERALGAYAHLDLASERGWVVVPMDTSLDLDLVLALVSVAIKANDR
jgi:hypothetical protein